jgi:hypothetical protein
MKADRPGMQRYANRSGHSGVRACELGSEFIRVQFTDGSVYRHDAAIPGRADVKRMKVLAIAGLGINSYIARTIQKRYAAKER